MRLEGKVVVVTGSSGIAAAGARRFAIEGARVHLIGVARDELESLSEELGTPSLWHQADLRDDAETVAAFDRIRESAGRLHGLFAVVGGSGRSFGDGPIHEVPLSGFEQTIALNLSTTFLSMREAVRGMREGGGGSIVVVSSVLANSPSPNFATHVYAAAKGGQLSLVRNAAASYANDGIRVNAIAPGLVATPMSERARSDSDTMSYVAAKQPLVGSPIDPDDVALTAVYLLSDESRAVTGQTIAVDGGWSVSEVWS